MHSTPDKAALEAAYAEVRGKVLPNVPAIVGFDCKYLTELVTDPLTLVPHWYRSEKLTNVTFETAKGEVQVRETEELIDQFRYETVDGGGSR